MAHTWVNEAGNCSALSSSVHPPSPFKSPVFRPGSVSPFLRRLPALLVFVQPQEGEDREAFRSPARASLSAAGTGPLPASPLPTPTAQSTRRQLAGRLRPNPQQLSVSKAAEVVAGPGLGGEKGARLPRPRPAALHEALEEAECPPSARHAPLRWLRPFPSRDPGRGRARSREGGPLQPDSSLKCSAARFLVHSFRGAQEAG